MYNSMKFLMIIRQEQLRVFADKFQSHFLARMVTHLRVAFPQELANRGLSKDEDICNLVLRGLEVSQQYEVINEGDVERYVECMLILGPQFDTDERFPEVKEILSRRTSMANRKWIGSTNT